MNKKIVLSTDIGSDIDDALALHIAMRHPEINLLGIYTTNGDVEIRAKIAKTMVDLSSYETVVATGEANALQGHPTAYSTGSEKNNIRPKYKKQNLFDLGIIEDGVKNLVTKLKLENPIIASIAPLTNIARAIESDSSLNTSKTQVYIMGGRVKNPEHNFRHDIEATRQVLDSNLDLVVMSGDLCEKYRRSIDEFKSLESPNGQYIQEMLNHWNTYNTWRGVMTSGIAIIYSNMLGKGAKFPQYFKNLIDTLKDPIFVKDYPKEYALTFSAFISILEDNEHKQFYDEIAQKVKNNIPKTVAVHDTYIIYGIVHPEKLTTKRVNLTVDLNGEMRINKGNKHTLVTDIDIEHFKGFLEQYLK